MLVVAALAAACCGCCCRRRPKTCRQARARKCIHAGISPERDLSWRTKMPPMAIVTLADELNIPRAQRVASDGHCNPLAMGVFRVLELASSTGSANLCALGMLSSPASITMANGRHFSSPAQVTFGQDTGMYAFTRSSLPACLGAPAAAAAAAGMLHGVKVVVVVGRTQTDTDTDTDRDRDRGRDRDRDRDRDKHTHIHIYTHTRIHAIE
jgi:hypothetical protein